MSNGSSLVVAAAVNEDASEGEQEEAEVEEESDELDEVEEAGDEVSVLVVESLNLLTPRIWCPLC